MANDRNAYLLVWQEHIVALDLALTIKDLRPSARVIMLPKPDRALALIEAVNRPITAFIADEPDSFEQSKLALELRRRAAKVFLIGATAEEIGPTPQWDVFPIPFSAETVRHLLETC